jgi:DNA adenine methylase
MADKIRRLTVHMGETKILNGDFERVIRHPGDAIIYCDPPYWEQGGALYKHSFGPAEHIRLANALRECQNPWVLSYDDHPAIHELYAWADIRYTDELHYTIAAQTGGKRSRELLISPPKFVRNLCERSNSLSTSGYRTTQRKPLKNRW